jgi:hypothetical protein
MIGVTQVLLITFVLCLPVVHILVALADHEEETCNYLQSLDTRNAELLLISTHILAAITDKLTVYGYVLIRRCFLIWYMELVPKICSRL